MPRPVQLLSRYDGAHEREGSTHFVAREGQAITLWVVRGLLAATVFTMVTFYFWAIIPATLLLIAYLVLMAFNLLERRSRGSEPAPDIAAEPVRTVVVDVSPSDRAVPSAEPEWKRPTIRMTLVRHETVLLGVVVLAAFVLATVLAATLLHWRIVLVAIPFVAAYILLLSAPVWFAALEDEMEDEAQQVSWCEPEVR